MNQSHSNTDATMPKDPYTLYLMELANRTNRLYGDIEKVTRMEGAEPHLLATLAEIEGFLDEVADRNEQRLIFVQSLNR